MSERLPTAVVLNLEASNKEVSLSLLADALFKAKKISSKSIYLQAVLEREKLLSTYCGEGIAIPHAASEAVLEPGFIFARTPGEMEWDADDEPVRFIILLAIPQVKEGEDNSHIEMMSEIASLALEEEVRTQWKKAKNSEAILETFK